MYRRRWMRCVKRRFFLSTEYQTHDLRKPSSIYLPMVFACFIKSHGLATPLCVNGFESCAPPVTSCVMTPGQVLASSLRQLHPLITPSGNEGVQDAGNVGHVMIGSCFTFARGLAAYDPQSHPGGSDPAPRGMSQFGSDD